jgi:hypothetical protein
MPSHPLLLGTIVLGLAVLLGLWAYYAWQLRRAGARRRRRAQQAKPAPGGGDEAQRIEPTLDAAPPADEPRRVAAREAEGAARPPAEADLAQVAALDERVQSIARVEFPHAVAGLAILQCLPGSLRAGSKPIEVRGLLADPPAWYLVEAPRQYRAFAAGVLLANRHGPLNDIEYSEFVALVQRVADTLGGDAEFADMRDVVAQARQLDEFAAEHDADITVSLRPQGALWSPAFLEQTAGANGFRPGLVPGRLVHLSDDGQVLLSLHFDPKAALADDPNERALSSAQLRLDVPHVEARFHPLAALRHAATALALQLDARLTDASGRALDEQTWAELDANIKQLHAALEARQFDAGSLAARRLYSGAA